MKDRIYICIDLKSFFASVECIERNLDPLNTNLVVADPSRTDKTICLAVSPSLKSYKIGGRARLYEVKGQVRKVNNERRKKATNHKFIRKSYDNIELTNNNDLELDFIIAPPRMAKYIEYSKRVYQVYLKYISEEDIVVYSIDEIFADITSYLKLYNMTAHELVTTILNDVYKTTKLTATAGIGTNLFLAKVTMDIIAKKMKPNEFGARIAVCDNKKFREVLWNHKPITDFWRIGEGTSNRLKKLGIYTMADIARCSIKNEDVLYKIFGINAKLLIDHAWGYEPCTIKEIKEYKPTSTSITSGQVLHSPYDYKKVRIVVYEMINEMVLNLIEKGLQIKQIVLTIGYDIENINEDYKGLTTSDHYGRLIPKHSHGTINLSTYSSSFKIISDKTLELFDRIIDTKLLVRRINICLTKISKDNNYNNYDVQLDLFTPVSNKNIKKEIQEEEKIQQTIIELKRKFGKNALVRGIDLMEGATAIDRNKQIGGHHE